ncbi:MFS quinate transporter-like protein QutD [Paraphaeosphaeria sporulosa]|uniref:MFS quinate transporter-like protein QutD n=1 Tax=Paraphaeosphaeria sporulosa TaxID=1460663 RepID=A0A177CEP4_9PLEO|nr:MFS quinate transporter-like protein QutD [Paraphaeosphaeria sporulosa]OAG06105.1 MFS quinate transporter-like protein QutD [Paraphaeosphaeria sporulosa]
MPWNTHASGTQDPPEVRNWRIHMIALVASMSALAMGYDTAVIGGTMALKSFIRDFGWENVSKSTRDTIQANIVSTFQAGCFFGALLTFPIAEKIGRKRTVMIAGLVFLLGAVLQTAAQGNLNLIYSGRAIAGLGIGASSLTVPVYIAEVAPPSIRGRLVGIFEIASQGGGMLGFWINYATDQTVDVNSKAQWIIPLSLQLVPGMLLVAGMFWCPESPRWLARGDNFDAAEKILTTVRSLPSSHPYIQHEMGEIRAQVEERSTNHLSKSAQFRKLFQKGTRNRMGIGLALMLMQSFTGVNIITYYAPRIFETLGISGTSLKLFSTGFYGIAKTLGMITFTIIIVEKVGRRKGLIWGAALGCIPMWYIGGYVMRADPAAAAARGDISRDGWGYLAMVCVYVNAFIICATWQGITWTYASEIFPLDIRMLCVSLTTADTWLGSFIIARSTPYMISDLGYGAYFFFASVLLLMGVWAFLFVPETKGVSLEEMDALFSRPMHQVVWAQIRKKPLPLDEAEAERKKSLRSSSMEKEIGYEHAEVEHKRQI